MNLSRQNGPSCKSFFSAVSNGARLQVKFHVAQEGGALKRMDFVFERDVLDYFCTDVFCKGSQIGVLLGSREACDVACT